MNQGVAYSPWGMARLRVSPDRFRETPHLCTAHMFHAQPTLITASLPLSRLHHVPNKTPRLARAGYSGFDPDIPSDPTLTYLARASPYSSSRFERMSRLSLSYVRWMSSSG